MFKKLSASVVALVSLAAMSTAAVNFDNPKDNNLAQEITGFTADIPGPVMADKKAPAKIKVKDWTIMVFVNAKNNLEPYGLKDMNEMEMIGSSGRVNVVVEIGRMGGQDTSNGDWKGTRRYLIKKDTDTNTMTSPMLQDLGKTDMGDYKSVINFGKWAKDAYPARKTMLIIWNHGAGWVKSNKSVGVEKGISYDDESGNHINTPQMAAILKEIGGVDIYGSDACLMQMAEVIYEIKDSVKFIVGSEETEPGDGYTYNDLLAPLVANPGMSAEAFAKAAVEAYSNHYQARNEGSTQSYVRASAIPGFLTAVNDFTSAITKAAEKTLAKKARGVAQAYSYADNRDLYHFTKLVISETKDAVVKEKGTALLTYIEKKLVGHNRTTNGGGGGWYSPPADYSNSHGIAIYLPVSAPATGYNELQWSKYSNWDEFINWYQLP